MHTPKKQQGMTLIGWILVFMLAAVIAIVALKLIPVYLDGYKVYQSMASLAEDDTARGKPPNELRKLLLRRLDINMVTDVTSDDITLTHQGGKTMVEVEYEVRRQMFGNLYAVVVFNKTVEITGR
jgi:hypothetical protein